MRHTRPLVFTSVLLAGVLGAGAVGVGMAEGGLSAGLSLAGVDFNVLASSVSGTGFGVYGSNLDTNKNTSAVTTAGFTTAAMNDLCIAVPVKLPAGDYVIVINAPGESTTAEDVLLYAKTIDGDLTLTSAQAGVDASGAVANGTPGAFALASNDAVVGNANITAGALSAGKLSIKNVSVKIVKGGVEQCG